MSSSISSSQSTNASQRPSRYKPIVPNATSSQSTPTAEASGTATNRRMRVSILGPVENGGTGVWVLPRYPKKSVIPKNELVLFDFLAWVPSTLEKHVDETELVVGKVYIVVPGLPAIPGVHTATARGVLLDVSAISGYRLTFWLTELALTITLPLSHVVMVAQPEIAAIPALSILVQRPDCIKSNNEGDELASFMDRLSSANALTAEGPCFADEAVNYLAGGLKFFVDFVRDDLSKCSTVKAPQGRSDVPHTVHYTLKSEIRLSGGNVHEVVELPPSSTWNETECSKRVVSLNLVMSTFDLELRDASLDCFDEVTSENGFGAMEPAPSTIATTEVQGESDDDSEATLSPDDNACDACVVLPHSTRAAVPPSVPMGRGLGAFLAASKNGSARSEAPGPQRATAKPLPMGRGLGRVLASAVDPGDCRGEEGLDELAQMISQRENRDIVFASQRRAKSLGVRSLPVPKGSRASSHKKLRFNDSRNLPSKVPSGPGDLVPLALRRPIDPTVLLANAVAQSGSQMSGALSSRLPVGSLAGTEITNATGAPMMPRPVDATSEVESSNAPCFLLRDDLLPAISHSNQHLNLARIALALGTMTIKAPISFEKLPQSKMLPSRVMRFFHEAGLLGCDSASINLADAESCFGLEKQPLPTDVTAWIWPILFAKPSVMLFSAPHNPSPILVPDGDDSYKLGLSSVESIEAEMCFMSYLVRLAREEAERLDDIFDRKRATNRPRCLVLCNDWRTVERLVALAHLINNTMSSGTNTGRKMGIVGLRPGSREEHADQIRALNEKLDIVVATYSQFVTHQSPQMSSFSLGRVRFVFVHRPERCQSTSATPTKCFELLASAALQRSLGSAEYNPEASAERDSSAISTVVTTKKTPIAEYQFAVLASPDDQPLTFSSALTEFLPGECPALADWLKSLLAARDNFVNPYASLHSFHHFLDRASPALFFTASPRATAQLRVKQYVMLCDKAKLGSTLRQTVVDKIISRRRSPADKILVFCDDDADLTEVVDALVTGDDDYEGHLVYSAVKQLRSPIPGDDSSLSKFQNHLLRITDPSTTVVVVQDSVLSDPVTGIVFSVLLKSKFSTLIHYGMPVAGGDRFEYGDLLSNPVFCRRYHLLATQMTDLFTSVHFIVSESDTRWFPTIASLAGSDAVSNTIDPRIEKALIAQWFDDESAKDVELCPNILMFGSCPGFAVPGPCVGSNCRYRHLPNADYDSKPRAGSILTAFPDLVNAKRIKLHVRSVAMDDCPMFPANLEHRFAKPVSTDSFIGGHATVLYAQLKSVYVDKAVEHGGGSRCQRVFTSVELDAAFLEIEDTLVAIDASFESILGQLESFVPDSIALSVAPPRWAGQTASTRPSRVRILRHPKPDIFAEFEVPDSTLRCFVEFVDEGFRDWISVKHLRRIPRRADLVQHDIEELAEAFETLATLPPLLIRCVLADWQPTDSPYDWLPQAGDHLASLTVGQQFYGDVACTLAGSSPCDMPTLIVRNLLRYESPRPDQPPIMVQNIRDLLGKKSIGALFTPNPDHLTKLAQFCELARVPFHEAITSHFAKSKENGENIDDEFHNLSIEGDGVLTPKDSVTVMQHNMLFKESTTYKSADQSENTDLVNGDNQRPAYRQLNVTYETRHEADSWLSGILSSSCVDDRKGKEIQFHIRLDSGAKTVEFYHSSIETRLRLSRSVDAEYATDLDVNKFVMAHVAKQWCRARIIAVDDANQSVRVQLLDLGSAHTIEDCGLSLVRPSTDFFAQAFQAIECQLADAEYLDDKIDSGHRVLQRLVDTRTRVRVCCLRQDGGDTCDESSVIRHIVSLRLLNANCDVGSMQKDLTQRSTDLAWSLILNGHAESTILDSLKTRHPLDERVVDEGCPVFKIVKTISDARLDSDTAWDMLTDIDAGTQKLEATFAKQASVNALPRPKSVEVCVTWLIEILPSLIRDNDTDYLSLGLQACNFALTWYHSFLLVIPPVKGEDADLTSVRHSLKIFATNLTRVCHWCLQEATKFDPESTSSLFLLSLFSTLNATIRRESHLNEWLSTTTSGVVYGRLEDIGGNLALTLVDLARDDWYTLANAQVFVHLSCVLAWIVVMSPNQGVLALIAAFSLRQNRGVVSTSTKFEGLRLLCNTIRSAVNVVSEQPKFFALLHCLLRVILTAIVHPIEGEIICDFLSQECKFEAQIAEIKKCISADALDQDMMGKMDWFPRHTEIDLTKALFPTVGALVGMIGGKLAHSSAKSSCVDKDERDTAFDWSTGLATENFDHLQGSLEGAVKESSLRTIAEVNEEEEPLLHYDSFIQDEQKRMRADEAVAKSINAPVMPDFVEFSWSDRSQYVVFEAHGKVTHSTVKVEIVDVGCDATQGADVLRVEWFVEGRPDDKHSVFQRVFAPVTSVSPYGESLEGVRFKLVKKNPLEEWSRFVYSKANQKLNVRYDFAAAPENDEEEEKSEEQQTVVRERQLEEISDVIGTVMAGGQLTKDRIEQLIAVSGKAIPVPGETPSDGGGDGAPLFFGYDDADAYECEEELFHEGDFENCLSTDSEATDNEDED